jgi:hypothetical protein
MLTHILKKILTAIPLLIYSRLEYCEIPRRGGEIMPARRAKKAKPKKAKKPAKKRPARKAVKRAVRKVTASKPRRPAGPEYSCILCGVEVAVTKSGLGISRLMCCGQPMSRR